MVFAGRPYRSGFRLFYLCGISILLSSFSFFTVGNADVANFTMQIKDIDNGRYRGVFDYACAFGFGCFLLVFKKNMDAFPAALWQQRELISILWFAREFTLPGQDQFGRCL